MVFQPGLELPNLYQTYSSSVLASPTLISFPFALQVSVSPCSQGTCACSQEYWHGSKLSPLLSLALPDESSLLLLQYPRIAHQQPSASWSPWFASWPV